MTKIITKLPVDADEFKKFRELALKKMIDDAAKVIEKDFPFFAPNSRTVSTLANGFT